MNNTRSTLCEFDNEHRFKSMWYSDGETNHLFVHCRKGFYDLIYKRSFGFIKSYSEENFFTMQDVLLYINAIYDFSRKNLNKTIESDEYLNSKIKEYLISVIDWDDYGGSTMGNYGHKVLASGPDAFQGMSLQLRLEEIKEREYGEIVDIDDIDAPWIVSKYMYSNRFFPL